MSCTNDVSQEKNSLKLFSDRFSHRYTAEEALQPPLAVELTVFDDDQTVFAGVQDRTVQWCVCMLF